MSKHISITSTNTARYFYLQYYSTYYLLDVDVNKWAWLFPFTVWFFPITVQRIERPFVDLEITPMDRFAPLLLVPIVMMMSTTVLPSHFNVPVVDLPNWILIVTLILVQCFLLFAKLTISQHRSFPLPQIKERMVIYFDKAALKKFYLKRMGAVALLLLAIITCAVLFIVTHLSFLIIIYMLLSAAYYAISPIPPEVVERIDFVP